MFQLETQIQLEYYLSNINIIDMLLFLLTSSADIYFCINNWVFKSKKKLFLTIRIFSSLKYTKTVQNKRRLSGAVRDHNLQDSLGN